MKCVFFYLPLILSVFYLISKSENSLIATQASIVNQMTTSDEVDRTIENFFPENIIETLVISDDEWLMGARFGEPRSGHPEGAIIFHIQEVLENVEKYYGSSPMREKLRIITIIHDTFKYKVDRSQPKSGENQHGMIARHFAEKYINDKAILEVIQRHDDAYFAWRFGALAGNWERAYRSADLLIDSIGKGIELFIAFFECDNDTGDKTLESVMWFKEYHQQRSSLMSCEANFS